MRETLSYEELKDETSIPDRVLTRALQPLAIGKASQRILVKNPKTKDIEPTHTFQVIIIFSNSVVLSGFYKIVSHKIIDFKKGCCFASDWDLKCHILIKIIIMFSLMKREGKEQEYQI